MAIHAYGKIEIIKNEETIFYVLEQMISNYASAYLAQWNDLSYNFKSKMTTEIIAFKITVAEIYSKENNITEYMNKSEQ